MTPLEQRARELLAEAMGVQVASTTELDLSDYDQCFIGDALRAIMSALSDDGWRPIEEGGRNASAD